MWGPLLAVGVVITVGAKFLTIVAIAPLRRLRHPHRLPVNVVVPVMVVPGLPINLGLLVTELRLKEQLVIVRIVILVRTSVTKITPVVPSARPIVKISRGRQKWLSTKLILTPPLLRTVTTVLLTCLLALWMFTEKGLVMEILYCGKTITAVQGPNLIYGLPANLATLSFIAALGMTALPSAKVIVLMHRQDMRVKDLMPV